MKHLRSRRSLRNKRALGEAISALIIVVASVVLSAVVVLLATNITASQVQKEKLFIASSHIWYVDNSTSIAALGISNIGSTDSVLTKITVNGYQCNWNSTNSYVICCKINGDFPGDLTYPGQISKTGNTQVTIDGQRYTFAAATEELTVKSGNSIAFYIVVPNTILVEDISMPVDIILTTTQSVYCTETLVQTT
jgi:hypothetical protein